MPDRAVGITDTAAGAGVAQVSIYERGSTTLTTTTTADPGGAGTTLAVTSAANFGSDNNYKVLVDNEIMLVTAGAGTLSWTVARGQDGTAAVAHSIGARVAYVVGLQRFIPVPERVRSYQGMWSSFRTLGVAAVNTNMFSIINKTGSTVLVAIRDLNIVFETVTADLTVADTIMVSRITATPTGGTVLTPVSFDTTLTHNASCEAMGATTADGAAATAIVATAGTRMWSTLRMRLATAVGQVLYPQEPLIPLLCADDPITLRAGEGLLVQAVQAGVAGDSFTVNCCFEEYTLP